MKLAEILMVTLSAALVLFMLLSFFNLTLLEKTISSALIFTITFIYRFNSLSLDKLNDRRFVKYLNDQRPQLEESTDLLLTDEHELTSLERLQKEKLITTFEEIYPTLKLPNHLGLTSIIFIVSIIGSILFSSFVKNENRKIDAKNSSQLNRSANIKSKPLPASINKLDITVTPPQYTKYDPYNTGKPELNIPEGSNIVWHIEFTDVVKDVKLIFSGNDSLKESHLAKEFTFKKHFNDPNFYQITWLNNLGERKISDYYKIEIIKDEVPEVSVTNLEQFTELAISDNLKLNVKSTLSDDYGIKDSYIIATVSKGSGESVKFREEKLPFTSPKQIMGKQINASLIVDLIKLGLEPGDELYFYVEALDTKTPLSNRSRTETFFIALQDTASESSSVEAGLGVDLMPEYFRSQRQIIIDSEKLLKQRKSITKQVFNSTSNELGYDQKVLRLKYGEFLGEEFESGIGPGAMIPDDDHEQDVTKQYGHVHDKENEHNLVAEKKNESAHDHGKVVDPDKKEDPTEAYKHVHDDPEEATLFTQSIRAKLKAALTVMWDAELHLRLFDPEKSLPYQYKALKLLKEISNDSRIYVHKTGFDPPPLKEEKRLSGDLSEIKNTRYASEQFYKEVYPAISYALTLTEFLLQQTDIVLTQQNKNDFQHAGKELSAFALEQPGKFLRCLSLIKKLDEENDSQNLRSTLLEIRIYLWKAIPQGITNPQAKVKTTHSLDRAFIQKFEQLKHE
jgi:hypothetical protein